MSLSTQEKLEAVRAQMRAVEADYLLVPRSDRYQGEYVAACDERLAWLTGFDGSAGACLVGLNSAHMFVDGRYTLQVQQQCDSALFGFEDLISNPPSAFIAKQAPSARLAYDPWLHTPAQLARFAKAAPEVELVPLTENPLDALWQDRPSAPASEAFPLADHVAGESVVHKLGRVRAALPEGASFYLSAPEDVAWLLNLRGRDLDYTPSVLASAILTPQQVLLFMPAARASSALREKLAGVVTYCEPNELEPRLSECEGHPVVLDRDSVPEAVYQQLQACGADVEVLPSPIALMRACKNEQELEGMRKAHERDALAVCRFLHWLEETPIEQLDEQSAEQQLDQLRAELPYYHSPSFNTISAFGPNGAYPHYRCTPETNRAFCEGSLYLVDSGGQYHDGTTDITRVVPVGEPSAEQRRHFTLVLKGMIALSRQHFPAGTRGSTVDILARQFLWQAGLDYNHGTGHGVGCFLGVHEGPQRISSGGDVALQPGMVVSNEPGYYQVGDYGIRIENLVAVTTFSAETDQRPMLGFETLTWVPIDRRLIERDMLENGEREWLDTYHQGVRERLHDTLANDGLGEWLMNATAPI